MTYLHFIARVVCGVVLLLPLAAKAVSEGLPISFSINSPLIISDTPWRVDVYQDDELSVARQHQANKQELYSRAQAGKVNWDVSSTFIAGDPTGNRLAKYQNIGRDIWQIRELRDLQQGHLYTNETFEEIQWSVNDLVLSLRRGTEDETINGVETLHYVLQTTYSYTTVDRDENERKQKEITAQRDFWFAPTFPFSPLHLLPLHLSGSTFVTHAPDRVQEAIYQRLEKRFRQYGMLMRTRLELGGEKYTIEVSDLKRIQDLDLAKVLDMPIIPESKVGAVAGPLFLARMLDDSMPEEGEMNITFGSGNGQTKVAGKAAFDVMETGDLAIASTFTTASGLEGLLVLMRPVLGMVESGEHVITPRRENEVLKNMSPEQLLEHASAFQAFALVDDEKSLKVYTDAVEGNVTIESIDGDYLSGTFTVQMNVLKVIGGSGEQRERVTGTFTAVKGLDARLRSPASRYLP